VLMWEKLINVRLAENEMESRAATFFLACYLEMMLVAPWCCCLLLLLLLAAVTLSTHTTAHRTHSWRRPVQ
jgi:hypothetical protein